MLLLTMNFCPSRILNYVRYNSLQFLTRAHCVLLGVNGSLQLAGTFGCCLQICTFILAVYIYRNPKDVCVSMYYHYMNMSAANPTAFPAITFDQYFEMFLGPSAAIECANSMLCYAMQCYAMLCCVMLCCMLYVA